MPRFVVLLHRTPPGYPRGTHFDLMLEHDGTLRTWALSELPAAGQTVDGEALADHRLEYLSFEGELAGGRGAVCRVDAGTYDSIQAGPDSLTVSLQGAKLRGTLTLQCDDLSGQRWRVSLVA